jgi:hypothetical protein
MELRQEDYYYGGDGEVREEVTIRSYITSSISTTTIIIANTFPFKNNLATTSPFGCSSCSKTAIIRLRGASTPVKFVIYKADGSRCLT